MRLRYIVPFLLAASAAFAQNAPMVIIGGDQPAAAPEPTSAATQQAVANSFPDWAVTSVGANTSGQNKDIPSAPSAPASPAMAPAQAPATTPATPKAPKAPTSPIAQAWPFDSVPIFMKACVGYSVQLVSACSCVINKLVNTMPHDEFLRLSADGSIEQDPRLLNIRSQCATAPRARKE